MYQSNESSGEQIPYEYEGEECPKKGKQQKKTISVGDSLPYGPRMFYETSDNTVRLKDIGENNRILLVGVLGSFTPDCWNRHFFRVLSKLKYYEERDVDYICCVATNDPYTQRAWGACLGCEDTVLMWADTTKRFTKAMGMDTVLPWLDDNVRSKRYVLLADDMVVTKMISAPCDNKSLGWQCEHISSKKQDDDEDDDDEDDDDEDPWV